MLKRIGIYGGTFDPIHFGHLLLAETSRETLNLDRVFFVPAKRPPHKPGKRISPDEDRLAMLRLALKGNRSFAVDTFELEQDQTSFTIHTVEYFHEKYPVAELFLLMGEDMLRIFPDWYQPQRICELATPAVIGRGGNEIPDLGFLSGTASRECLAKIKKSRGPMPAVSFSSTAIREFVQLGKSIRYQTPASVARYIQSKGLYLSRD